MGIKKLEKIAADLKGRMHVACSMRTGGMGMKRPGLIALSHQSVS